MIDGWLGWVMAGMLLMLVARPMTGQAQEVTQQGILLYSRLTDGTWQIWQTDLTNRTRTQLTFSAGDKRYPTWAPDGRIAYHTSNHRCYLTQPGAQGDQPLLAALWPVRDLAWSPNGKWAAFSRSRADTVDSANLWVADPQGREQRMMTHEEGLQYNPAWSPDGTQMAYVGGHGYGTYELYLIKADGTGQHALTVNHTHEFLPAWSPDGTHIVYAADASGEYEIWVIAADGSNAKQLTTSSGLDTRPAWSPDGTQIAFTTNRSGVLEIWVMNADGTNQRILEQADGGVCDPAWH